MSSSLGSNFGLGSEVCSSEKLTVQARASAALGCGACVLVGPFFCSPPTAPTKRILCRIYLRKLQPNYDAQLLLQAPALPNVKRAAGTPLKPDTALVLSLYLDEGVEVQCSSWCEAHSAAWAWKCVWAHAANRGASRTASRGKRSAARGRPARPPARPAHPRQYNVCIDGVASNVTILAGSGKPGYADGTGIEAAFNEPKGLEISPDGAYLYVTEYANHRIRRVEIATGTVTTVAGSGNASFADGTDSEASFNQPAGLALFPDGQTLLVGDISNSRIRSIDLSTNAVSTLAGSAPGYADGPLATALFAAVGDVVVAPDATKVYVADGGLNLLRVIDLHDQSVSTLAGSGDPAFADGLGATAAFAFPYGLDVTKDGSTLLVADFLNNRIRSVAIGSGAVTTLAGSGNTSDFGCPMRAMPPGSSCGGFADGTGAAAAFNWPASGTLTPDEEYYVVADYFNQKVRAVHRATGEVSTLAFLDGSDTAAGYAGPADVVASPDGSTLYVSQRNGQRIAALTVPQA